MLLMADRLNILMWAGQYWKVKWWRWCAWV